MILLAIADADQRDLFKSALQPGFQFIEASNLTDVERQIAEYSPHLMIFDPDFPDGDGLQWIRQLRRAAQCEGMLIVCVTTRSLPKQKVAGFRAGVDDYLVYPINFEVFPYRVALLKHVIRTFQR
jgi:DNA-binding response OmpR family regulator